MKTRVPVLRKKLPELIARRTWVGNVREMIVDRRISLYMRYSTRAIRCYETPIYVDVVEIGNVDLPEEHQRQGVFREALGAIEEIARAHADVRGVYVEIVHAAHLVPFLTAQGYVDPNPRRGVYTDGIEFSFFKDLHPEWGEVHGRFYRAHKGMEAA
jgi:hypothetical protein